MSARRTPSAFDGQVFVTPSGRRWRAGHDWFGKVYMQPLGATGFGGVKGRYVDPARLDGLDKIWRPARA